MGIIFLQETSGNTIITTLIQESGRKMMPIGKTYNLLCSVTFDLAYGNNLNYRFDPCAFFFFFWVKKGEIFY